ncbi:putative glycosyl [Erysiphe necator]|uniref:Putative glycosyl n=1 Tax=Uncinula necator TaxID=52586 RepID=A0A0B1PBN2_UNCNE|nr:putative glycosyl [Erysiphe necator]
METLGEIDQHIWTPPEIQYQLARGHRNSRLIVLYNEMHVNRKTKDPEAETYETKSTLVYKNIDAKQIPFKQILPSQVRSSQPYSQYAPENSSSDPNPQIMKNFSNYKNSGGRAITNLRKIYTQELKFCGADDSLSLKLEIFYDLCAENGITEDLYRIALPIMLSGQAHTYYYSTIAKLNLDFNGAVQMLQNQYETEQRQQKDFSEWSTITLANVLTQNSNKSLQEFFELMLENQTLRVKVINACRSIPECSLACYSPAPSLEGVCYQLRSSIATAMELSGKSFFNQNTQPSGQFVGQNDESQFFTYRCYHGVNKYNRTSKHPNDKNRFSKKCFVCKQPGCWSTKHSKSERNIAYDNFRKRIQQRGRRPDESMISQYVFEYEGE